jgi:hypothetical protein
MLEHSIITKTGQWWKFIVTFAGFIAGCILLLLGIRGGFGLEPNVVLVLWGFGLAILFFPLFMISVRCPECGVRWIWLAARSKQIPGWLVWVFALQECPKCGALGESKPRRSQSRPAKS